MGDIDERDDHDSPAETPRAILEQTRSKQGTANVFY